jgi:hypothetical protein
MADSLKDLYNTPAQPWHSLSDPFTIKKPASWAAYNEFDEAGESGGKTDALRHLLGAATLTRRQGPEYAAKALNWHENPDVFQFLGGGYGQRPEDRQMDLHNNTLGMHIGNTAKTYDEALQMAKQFINEGRVRYAKDIPITPQQPSKPQTDYVDSAITGGVDLVRKMFSK